MARPRHNETLSGIETYEDSTEMSVERVIGQHLSCFNTFVETRIEALLKAVETAQGI